MSEVDRLRRKNAPSLRSNSHQAFLGLISPGVNFLVAARTALNDGESRYFYVAPKWRQSAIPLEQSWLTRAGSEDFTRLDDYTDEYRPGARWFDAGEFPQFLLVPTAIAALRQILAWGVTRIETALSAFTPIITQRATEHGYLPLPPDQRCGHMIGIRHPGRIPSGLVALLKEAKVFGSIRGDSVRVAPHLYNDLNDIDRLFEVLQVTHVGN